MSGEETGVSLVVGSGAVGVLAGIVTSYIKARMTQKVETVSQPTDQRQCDALHASNESAHTLLFSKVSVLEQKTAHAEGKLELIISGQRDTNHKLDRLLSRHVEEQ